MKLLYKDLTYKLRGCFFDVQNALGTGYDEETYHLALVHHLKKRQIPFETKATRYIEHRGIKVHKFEIDLIIDKSIILELKSIPTSFTPHNYLQIISYLKCCKKDLGLLINFGQSKVKIERVLFSEKQLKIEEDYSEIKGLLSSERRKQLIHLREAILTIFDSFGLGYNDTIYRALLQEELTFKSIPFVPFIYIPVEYDGQVIREFELKLPVIANDFICGVTALKEDLELDIHKMKTYLKATGIPFGVLAHFGKDELDIIGISPTDGYSSRIY